MVCRSKETHLRAKEADGPIGIRVIGLGSRIVGKDPTVTFARKWHAAHSRTKRT